MKFDNFHIDLAHFKFDIHDCILYLLTGHTSLLLGKFVSKTLIELHLSVKNFLVCMTLSQMKECPADKITEMSIVLHLCLPLFSYNVLDSSLTIWFGKI